MPVRLLHPLVAQLLGLCGEVSLFCVIHHISVFFFQLPVQIGQLDGGKKRRDNDIYAQHLFDLCP